MQNTPVYLQDQHELFPINMDQDDQTISQQLVDQMSTVGFCLVTNVNGHSEE